MNPQQYGVPLWCEMGRLRPGPAMWYWLKFFALKIGFSGLARDERQKVIIIVSPSSLEPILRRRLTEDNCELIGHVFQIKRASFNRQKVNIINVKCSIIFFHVIDCLLRAANVFWNGLFCTHWLKSCDKSNIRFLRSLIGFWIMYVCLPPLAHFVFHQGMIIRVQSAFLMLPLNHRKAGS